MNVVGVPKTIDNDLAGTDFTFGFQTAVQIATDAIDRLHTTAESHNRVIVVEVMGRHAGWIAAYSGLAGGADVVLVPERPFDIDEVVRAAAPAPSRARAQLLDRRRRRGRDARRTASCSPSSRSTDSFGHVRLGGIAIQLEREIEERTGFESRMTILGHVQRGGTPLAYDRVLGSRFGVEAIDAVSRGRLRADGRAARDGDRAGTAGRGTRRAQAPGPEAVRDGRGVLRLSEPSEPIRVSRRRRLLGAPAIAAHRLALGLVRRLPPPRRSGDAHARPRVRIVIHNAFAMGGTVRTTLNLAEHLARAHEVELVSVRRHTAKTFFAHPEGVAITVLDDLTADPGGVVRSVARKLPSLLVHPEDYAYPGASLLTDVRLARLLRRSGGDVVIATRPAYSLLVGALARGAVTIGQEHLNFAAHRPALAADVRRGYGQLDALAVLTAGDAGDYGRFLEGSGTRVVQIPNAIPPLGGGGPRSRRRSSWPRGGSRARRASTC